MTASNQVPGSTTITGNPEDSVLTQSAAADRCPRCERHRWETPCGGVNGATH